MIAGQITSYHEAVVPLVLVSSAGAHSTVDAVLDTGFTEFITLPSALIASLDLPQRGSATMSLADGSKVHAFVHDAEIIWDGQPLRVSVIANEGGPLIGMALLYGMDLSMRVLDGGAVTISAVA